MLMTILADSARLLEILLPAAGVTLILAGVVMWGRKRRQQAKQSNLSPREQLHRMKEERAVRGDLEQIMVEIEQLAKRMGAQLDAKSMRLERLLREADAKIAELERQPVGQPAPGEAEPAPPPASPGVVDDEPTESPAQAPFGTVNDDRELTDSVYRLSDAGLTPLEIARQLNEHQGKIELVLALRQS
ncbi:hypothetical protein ACERK3_03315 [Phycisphaerales bacterium AB-hyl4]|uniref:DUF2802 domain-containing protein n=1 Tax=Natronomicrosphaera hydrolytica TaxID=3242702 RepID=A0ABV4U147_9BACT